MARKPSSRPQKRRTTLALPVESLAQAQSIAHARRSTMNSVITEAVIAGLRLQRAAERRDEVMESYRRAFSGFNDEELSVLDGIVPESSGGQ